MNRELRHLYEQEIRLFKISVTKNSDSAARNHLGRAHIISQQSFQSHFYIHALMLGYALKTKNFSEVLGQIIRLVSTLPGHLIGKLPTGNIGWSTVGIIEELPIPDDILKLTRAEK